MKSSTGSVTCFWDYSEPDFQWPENLNQEIQTLLPYIEDATGVLEKLTTDDVQQLERDFQTLEQVRPQRLEYLELLKTGDRLGTFDLEHRPRVVRTGVDSHIRCTAKGPGRSGNGPAGVHRSRWTAGTCPRSILKRAEELKLSFADARQRIVNFQQDQQQKTPDEVFQYLRESFQQEIPGLLSELNNLTLEITLLQASARSNSIEIPEVSLDDEQAIRIARCFRRDWMNARAGLVDSWRNIEFVADQLESQLDLIFEGDMRLPDGSNNPLSYRYETGQVRAGFRFDSPIVRMSERNSYVNALISYQQDRRQLYRFEDAIKSNLRDLIRTVRSEQSVVRTGPPYGSGADREPGNQPSGAATTGGPQRQQLAAGNVDGS